MISKQQRIDELTAWGERALMVIANLRNRVYDLANDHEEKDAERLFDPVIDKLEADWSILT